MSAGAIIAGQVAIQAQVQNVHNASQNLNRLNRNMEKIEKTSSLAGKAMKGFGKAIALLVAINVIQRNIGKLNKVLRETVDQIDNLDKGSKRLGLSVQQYRNLSLAAQMAGSSIEQFETAFNSMQRNIANLALSESGGEAKGAFEELKLDMNELLAMEPAERLYRIAGALQEFGKHGDRAGLVMKIFGESGVRVLPMLDQGEEGLRSFVGQVERFIGVIDEGGVAQVAKMRDAIALWDASILTLQANLVTVLIPTIIDMIAALISAGEIISNIDLRFPNAVAATATLAVFGKEMTLLEATLHLINLEVTKLNIALGTLEAIAKTAMLSMAMFNHVVNEIDLRGSELFRDATDGLFGDGFEEQARAAEERVEKTGEKVTELYNSLLDTNKRLAGIGDKAKEGFDKAKQKAEDFKTMLEGVKDMTEGLKGLLGGVGDGVGGKVEEIKQAAVDMGKAFAGEAVRMGTASSEIQLRQMQNRQIEILKRIEENTATNVVVGV
jgi:hypothetical protein